MALHMRYWPSSDSSNHSTRLPIDKKNPLSPWQPDSTPEGLLEPTAKFEDPE